MEETGSMGAMDSWDDSVPFLLASQGGVYRKRQGGVYRKRERFRCFGRNDAAGACSEKTALA